MTVARIMHNPGWSVDLQPALYEVCQGGLEMSNMGPVRSRSREAESRHYVGKEDSQPL